MRIGLLINSLEIMVYRKLLFPFIKLHLFLRKNVRFAWKGYADHSTTFDGYNYIGENAFANRCHFGKGSYIAEYAKLCNVDIGKFSSIGPNVIGVAGSHPTKDGYISTSPSTYSLRPVSGLSLTDKQLYHDETDKIVIGNDVWIGGGAILLPEITIADGTIIGAGSVVTKSTEPFGIYVGNPAKLIRKRFEQSTIDSIMNNPWWDKEELFFDDDNIKVE